MFKTMSAMVDNVDTQMVDYMADIDMQVQGISSPWLRDEVKMEEDAPGLKLENFAQVNEDGHDQGDLTIEIDMEEHNSAEYDMVDDEQLHYPPEILDVEVYDASLAQSPAMGDFDSALPAESTFSPVVVPPTEPREADVRAVPDPTLTAESIAASVVPAVLAPVSEEILPAPAMDSPQDASHTDEPPNTVLSIHQSALHDAVEPLENDSSGEPAPPVDAEYPPSTDAAGAESVEGRSQQEVSLLPYPPLVEDLNSAPDEGLPPESLETPHTSGPLVESTSSGDPHEISEGVYIDPPPAVLLTISSDDHEHEFSLFNEPAEWRLPSAEHHPDSHRTLLHHLPTMYYESLYSLFEALRQDEFIQSTFHLLEVELVLQAVDLALAISEDNIYSRDVSLHDLNILHDGSGIGGPLKTKLYFSSPRFITQYQQLQEHVSRLQLGHQSGGVSFGGHTDTHDNQRLDLGHSPGHRGAPTQEGELETESLANSKESEEPEAETDLPQNSEPELAADLHEEEHEDENGVSQIAETGEDRDSRSDQEESATSHPPVENNEHDSVSADTEGETAVIGLVLEDEVDPQVAGDEHGDETPLPLHDGFDEGETEPELEDNLHDTQQAGSPRVPDEQDEVDQPEEGADGRGDEFSHEHTEYAEPDAEPEPFPDQFQALPQDVHEYHRSQTIVTKIDHTTLPENGDGQEYNGEGPLPELPTDPISFDDENWGQELEGFGDVDESWNGGDENEHSVSNQSSVTLSSRGSKRTFDEYESGGEGYDDEEDQQWDLPESPDPKRTRTQ